MALYRHVRINYWQDGFVLDLTPEEKYFYLYLMTNSKTTQCGIYELPKRIVEIDTGYNRETIEKLIERFVEYGKIFYDNDTKEVFVINWPKHNITNSPKVLSCVLREVSTVKSETLKELFYIECEKNNIHITKPEKECDMGINTHVIPIKTNHKEVCIEEKTKFKKIGEKEKEKQKEKEKEKEVYIEKVNWRDKQNGNKPSEKELYEFRKKYNL